jgi:GAF domain-containing protein
MAVSSPTDDPRFNRDVAEQSGYIPGAILAVPLVSGDHVFGVIEVLDKVSGESFSLQDIEMLSLLADQAAIALTQAKQFEQLQDSLVSGLKRLLNEGEAGPAPELLAALDSQPASSTELIRLAEMIKEVSALGEREQQACQQILQVFQEYSAAVPAAGFGLEL